MGYSVSCTTRPPRDDEKEGQDYYFLSTGEFLQRQQRGEFAESAEVHGNLYGTLRSEVERVLKLGQHVIMDIDVQGAMQFRSAFPESVLVYVLPPSGETLLDRLSTRRDVTLGLLTGNFREAARLKLEHHAIDHHFAFGGYGDQHHDRDDVARVAWSEACRHLGRDIDPSAVCVIGDTPSDVKCARAIGARAIAVATGMFSAEELIRSQPDELYQDFSDPDQFLTRMDRVLSAMAGSQP